MKIDIITPLFFNKKVYSKGEFHSRLSSLKDCIRNDNINVLTSDTYKDHHMGNIFSPGAERNKIVSNSSSDYLFFMDLDLLASPKFFDELEIIAHNLSRQGMSAFSIFPCIYLSKQKTTSSKIDYDNILKSLLRGENTYVDGIAVASSCLLVNREWFIRLGGFDECFFGHGGEDLELLDRLTKHYPIGPRLDDYAKNVKHQHPGDYEGFRRYFSYYSLPYLFSGHFLVHRWHPRPLSQAYHRQRSANDKLLENKLANTGPLRGPVSKCNALAGQLPDFRGWLISLQERAGYPVVDFPGLLRWREGVTHRRPLWRKIRKLYLNPVTFFRDMLKNIKQY